MIFTLAQWQAFQNATLPNALASFAQVKSRFMEGNVGKGTRPWFVLDFPSLLPQGSTMFGFEIETGFTSDTAKNAMMNWLWDNTDYTTVDHEGCSRYPVEITFPPITQDSLLNEDNQLLSWFRHNASLAETRRARDTQVTGRSSDGGCVGTHTNISTAAYRAASPSQQNAVNRQLQTAFAGLSSTQRLHLYGRQPYINDVARGRGGAHNGGDAAARIEFKMFHTTMNVEQFKNYCKVSIRLAEVIDSMLSNAWVGTTSTNFFNYLTQDLPRRTVIVSRSQYSDSLRNGSDPTYAVVPEAAVA